MNKFSLVFLCFLYFINVEAGEIIKKSNFTLSRDYFSIFPENLVYEIVIHTSLTDLQNLFLVNKKFNEHVQKLLEEFANDEDPKKQGIYFGRRSIISLLILDLIISSIEEDLNEEVSGFFKGLICNNLYPWEEDLFDNIIQNLTHGFALLAKLPSDHHISKLISNELPNNEGKWQKRVYDHFTFIIYYILKFRDFNADGTSVLALPDGKTLMLSPADGSKTIILGRKTYGNHPIIWISKLPEWTLSPNYKIEVIKISNSLITTLNMDGKQEASLENFCLVDGILENAYIKNCLLLKNIDLRNNRIKYLSAESLQNLPGLEHINVADNYDLSLLDINLDLAQLIKLNKIHFSYKGFKENQWYEVTVEGNLALNGWEPSYMKEILDKAINDYKLDEGIAEPIQFISDGDEMRKAYLFSADIDIYGKAKINITLLD